MASTVRPAGRLLLIMTAFAGWSVASPLAAEDWPQFRGPRRCGVWNETGILEKFPAGGLTVRWRTPVGGGYSGPAVAGGRVFVSDFARVKGSSGAERVHCLDERTGKVLWTFRGEKVSYARLGYASGPRATPTVDGERVYVLGAVGDLYCLDVKSGRKLWHRNFPRDLGATAPMWGFAGAPLVHGKHLICLAGGKGDAKVVAFDKASGTVIWRAIANDGRIGYCPPTIINAGGAEQLIQWHGGAVTSLDPNTGKTYWQQPFKLRYAMAVAMPVRDGNRLFISAFFDGPIMFRLNDDKPRARIVWRGRSSSEIRTDALHALMCTPVIKDGYIYGVCSYGQFRCLDAATGKRIWETLKVIGEKGRWATAFIVCNGERFFINNDRGELIIADLSPKGYREIDRTKLIAPTTTEGARHRTPRAVNWTPPAYANRHVVTRNDREIIRASLAKP